MGKYDNPQSEYSTRYRKKAYYQINIVFPKPYREVLVQEANKKELTVNEMIRQAVYESVGAASLEEYLILNPEYVPNEDIQPLHRKPAQDNDGETALMRQKQIEIPLGDGKAAMITIDAILKELEEDTRET